VAGSKHEHGMISDINVTPLVDITLVLLIILMVTSSFVTTSAVPLDLPTARRTETVSAAFSIIMTSTGVMHVDGEPVLAESALLTAARSALARDPATRAVIHAEGNVPHRRVLRAMDVLRQAGMARIAFAALPEDP
jgi:biopolymer transport protein ExbD